MRTGDDLETVASHFPAVYPLDVERQVMSHLFPRHRFVIDLQNPGQGMGLSAEVF